MTIPELSDAEGSTCYTPPSYTVHSPSYIIWNFRSLQYANALTIYQDGGRTTNAIVSVSSPLSPLGGAMDDGEWEELGSLSGYVSRFDLTPYPSAAAVKISWTSRAPLIYEIIEETDEESNTITGIKETDNEDSPTPFRGRIDAWYDLSGRKVRNGQLPKGVYIHNGKKIIK